MRIIVSLTTIPSRIKYLENLLKIIKRQTVQPDITYINIPHYSKKEKCEYPEINPEMLKKYNAEIIRCEDLGPITKLIPVLDKERDPNTIIITMDDDMSYTNDRIEQLLITSAQFPEAAISGDGWIVGGWYNYLTYILNPRTDTKVDIIQGCSACLYKRKFFDDLDAPKGASEGVIVNKGECLRHPLTVYPEEIQKYAFIHDDVWISGYLALNGIDRIVQSSYTKHINRNIATINALSGEFSFYYRIVKIINYFKKKGVFNESVPISFRSVGAWILIVLLILLILIFVVKFFIRRT